MLTMVMKLKHVLGMMVRVLMVVVVVVMLMVKRVMAMKVGLMVVRGLLMLILLNVFDGHNISRDGDVGMVMGLNRRFDGSGYINDGDDVRYSIDRFSIPI